MAVTGRGSQACVDCSRLGSYSWPGAVLGDGLLGDWAVR